LTLIHVTADILSVKAGDKPKTPVIATDCAVIERG